MLSRVCVSWSDIGEVEEGGWRRGKRSFVPSSSPSDVVDLPCLGRDVRIDCMDDFDERSRRKIFFFGWVKIRANLYHDQGKLPPLFEIERISPRKLARRVLFW